MAPISSTPPWGEEKFGSSPNDRVKFATYRRDSESGLDYAWNRYYDNATGRFLTPDPYEGSADPYNPQSWNRYGYGLGDPVGHFDLLGLCDVFIGGLTQGFGSDPGMDSFAEGRGMIEAFPYFGTGVPPGGATVAGEAIAGNLATQTAYDAIMAAAAEDPGLINIVTYSGGAAAFAAALPLIPASVASRIDDITYLSPGAVGSLPSSPSGGLVSVVLGQGPTDLAATLLGGTTYPAGTKVYPTGCLHSGAGQGAGCELKVEAQLMAQVTGGPCAAPGTISARPNFGAPHLPLMYSNPGVEFGFSILNLWSDMTVGLSGTVESVTDVISYGGVATGP